MEERLNLREGYKETKLKFGGNSKKYFGGMSLNSDGSVIEELRYKIAGILTNTGVQ